MGAEERNRISGQDLAESEERTFTGFVLKAKVGELCAWEHFRVFSPAQPGTQREELVNSRWVLTWKEAGGGKTVIARLVAKCCLDPDPRMGNVDIAGCASRRASNLQATSLGALMIWPLWSLGGKNAFPQAGGFDRGVYLRAPREWNSKGARRVWKLRAPAYGLNDAPVAYRRSLRKYLTNFVETLSCVGLRLEVSSFDPCLFFVYMDSGPAIGALTTHIRDNSGCGEANVLSKARILMEKRFGNLDVQ